MKYLIIFLLLFSCTFSEEVNFVCKNKNNMEPEYILAIDLKNKIMIRAGDEYKITSETNDAIVATTIKNIHNVNYETNLIFDRFSGDLLFRQFKNGKKNDFVDFACKKAGKKLI